MHKTTRSQGFLSTSSASAPYRTPLGPRLPTWVPLPARPLYIFVLGGGRRSAEHKFVTFDTNRSSDGEP